MSKNYVNAGDSLGVTAPAGGVGSGDGVLVDSLFGVATFAADAGQTVVIKTTGVFEMPKAAGAVTAGAKLYWDDSASNVTTTATDNSLIGAAVSDQASGDPTVAVRLNGITI
ncbi:MAG: hypothetical protein AcusKO_29400 [Acuticoccus sp.]